MKHIYSLIALSIVFVTGAAFAHDLTYLGPIKNKESVSLKLELPKGELTVEVFSSDKDTKFNCDFGFTYGEVVLEQTNTSKCFGNFNVTSHSAMLMKVTNLSKDSDYKIWVHNRR